MNAEINAAREILDGMEARAYAKEARGGTVAPAVWDAIEKRQIELDNMIEAHERRHGNQTCRCRAHEHGGDCMCFE